MEEEYAYGAHFALRVLVLPVAPLRKKEYERQLSVLKHHSKIALADIPPTTTGGKPINPLIAPTPASRGFLNLNFVESWDADLAWLNEYQVHRRVMGVVGLLDCAEWTGQNGDGDLQDGARAFRDILKAEAPAEVFATRCYAFNPRDTQSDNAEGLVVIPNVGDLNFYINTLLAELASNMLAGVSQILEDLNSKSHVQMPMGRPVTIPVPSYQPAATPGTPGTEQRMSLSVLGTPTTERSISPLPILPPTRPSSVTPLPGSPSGSGTAGDTSDAKARKKHPGRIAKLKGDLLCLAGKHQDGVISYNEATLIARAQSDYAWQAAAIEANIMSQTYQSWLNLASKSAGHIARPSLSGTSLPRGEPAAALKDATLSKDLPPRYMDALALYTRPAPPAGKPSNSNGTDGTLTPQILAAEPEIVIHPVLYVESCMRCLRMQLALLLRGPTWDAATASLLVGKTSIWPRPSAIDLLGRTLSGPVSKADIQSTIALAYSQLRSTSLRLEDRQQGLEAIIQIYDALHLSRRKAAIQRELAVMMSTDVTIERIQAAEMDLAGDVSAIAAEVTARSRKQMGAKEEVLDALESTYRIYGLPNATDEGKNIPSFLPPQSIRCLLETVFERFGWLEIQYALVREGARMSELLPDLAATYAYTLLALRSTLDAMASKEQRSYMDDIRRLNSEAARLNLDVAKSYWGPEYPLLSVQILDLPAHLRVTEQIVKAASIDAAHSKADFSDLLVYSVARSHDPVGGIGTVAVMIAEEPGEVSIRLQNPYSVPLQVDSIQLLYSGVGIAGFPPVSVTLPPLEAQTITLVCTPIEPGELIIQGCKIRIAGCPARDFMVPINALSKGEEVLKTMHLPLLEHSRLKSRDYESWYDTREQVLRQYNESEDFKFLSCKVVPKQPLLRLNPSSSAAADASLYEGEAITLQSELANITTVHITSMKVQLEDNVTSYQKGLLSQEGISPLLAYEVELDMQQSPVMRVERDGDGGKVPPDGTLNLKIHCLGKPGLAQGLAIVEYASLSSDASAAHVDRFYARELRIPFAFAVTPCLRCQGWKVRHQGAKQRINHNLDRANTADGVPDSETIRGSVFSLDDAETFLLALEVSNISLERAFEAILTCSDSVGARVEERIEPGSAVTIALPIAKIRLSEEQKSRPLPALSDRQFVVGKNALPAVELERFWLREELLRTVKLAWREVGSERTGACNLRHLNLDDAMLSDMQLKDFPLRSEVRQNGELCSRDDEHRWHVEECNFTEISLFLHNLKTRPVTMSVRLKPRVPVQQNIDSNTVMRNVILDGDQVVFLPTLAPGQTLQTAINFSLCFMSKGTFTIDILLEEDNQDTTTASIARAANRVEHSVHFNVS